MKIQFSIKMNVGSSGAIVTIILSQYHFYSFFMYVCTSDIYNKMAQDISQGNESYIIWLESLSTSLVHMMQAGWAIYQASRDEDLGVLWIGVLADPVRSEEEECEAIFRSQFCS